MKTFTVTQKILSLGATYSAALEGSQEAAYVIKGKILALAPKLEMRKADQGDVLKTLKANLWGTRFSIIGQSGTEDGSIQFPLMSLTARFTLCIGPESYSAKGGFTARHFSCAGRDGSVKLSVSKEWALRDRFMVSMDESVPEEVGILAAVAIDQKYFQRKN